ncbi:MAG: HNH endonuclease [Verrucomicrobia bacterium]|nr:HNH endonuclease [Verrucomicrobiota bacterium]
MSKNPNWTREQHLLAFRLYNEIPFGSIHTGNPKLQELADLIGRGVNAVSLKLANFARLDPVQHKRNIKGMSHGAKGEAEIWDAYLKNPEALAWESDVVLAKWSGKSLEEIAEIETSDLPPEGKERAAVVKVRSNQNFFRRRVLSVYDFRCCITGLGSPALLTASHILPWSTDRSNRLNPKNGLCLNALHDRAFDRHLMWIDASGLIRYSPSLRSAKGQSLSAIDWLFQREGQPLLLPQKFAPDPEFLRQHAAKCTQS